MDIDDMKTNLWAIFCYITENGGEIVSYEAYTTKAILVIPESEIGLERVKEFHTVKEAAEWVRTHERYADL